MTRFLPFTLLPLAFTCLAQEGRIVLATDRPGNLFADGDPIEVNVAGQTGPVDWSVVDYWGETVAQGSLTLVDGKGAIKIPAQPRGYYEVTCKSGDQKASLAFGVIADHSATDSPSTRLNVDGATAWLEHQNRHGELAKMLRAAGIGWVRERFAWGGTEPEKGKVEYARGGRDYDAVAQAFADQGVRVYQIWHDTPGWTHPGGGDTRNPADLRDVYNFAKRTAEHYKGTVQAWEVWNEPDIGFWPDLGDTFAGLQKAAYLGFKAGDPNLSVLLGSFCRGYCAFDESLFEAGIADYFDIFNWHIYAGPDRYQAVLGSYLNLLGRYGCETRPVWLSEAGIRLNADEPDGELSAEKERQQAEFIAPSFACSLAAGTDNHFFFVYPWYLENGIQFGALRKDLSPRPAFIAIAAAADIFGESTYLGRYDFGEGKGDVWGQAFDTPRGNVLVLWSKQEAQVTFQTGMRSVGLADLFGEHQQVQTDGGNVTVTVGSSPQYMIGWADDMRDRLSGQVRPAGVLPHPSPHPVVMRGEAKGVALQKDSNAYMIGTDPFTYTVEVCNFGDATATGTIRIEAPRSWRIEPVTAAVTLEPMGRSLLEFTVTPAAARRSSLKLWVRADFEGEDPAPSVSYLRFDVSKVKPASARDLPLNEPAAWGKNIAGIGTMQILPAEGGGVSFPVKFTRPGDRWAYPQVTLDPPQDWSSFDGLSLEYRTGGDDAMYVRAQVIEGSGASYLGELGRGSAEWRHAAVLFEDLHWGSWSRPDPNGKLDLNDVATLLVGLNTNKDDVKLEVRNVKVFRLAE